MTSGSAANPTAVIRINTMRDCDMGSLLFGRDCYSGRISTVASAGWRSEEQFLAILESDLARMAPVAAIARVPSGYGDLVALLDGDVFFPAGPIQHVGRKSLQFPVADLARRVLDVQIDKTMRVCPLHFGYDPGQSDRFVRIILSAK